MTRDEFAIQASALLEQVIDEHIHVDQTANWCVFCVFCGRWPEDHDADCVILKINALLAEVAIA